MTISPETLKLAQEKGYDEETHSCFYHIYYEDEVTDATFKRTKLIESRKPNECLKDEEFGINTCFQFELQKWLREKHDIHITVVYIKHKKLYGGHIEGNFEKLSRQIIPLLYSTYEEALEVGLQKALEELKNYKNNEV